MGLNVLKRKSAEEQLLVCVRTIPDPRGLRPYAHKGEVRAAGDRTAQRYPDCFEPVEPVTRGPEPGPGEAVAIARAHFVAFDGRSVWANRRFALHDEIVRRHRELFWIELPGE
jgi:hypothetical protein